MTLQELVTDIHTINKLLVEFELRYGLLSETFLAWYQQGNEPEETAWLLDFAEWAGWLKSRDRLLALYRQRVLELLSSDGNDLNHLMQQSRQLVTA